VAKRSGPVGHRPWLAEFALATAGALGVTFTAAAEALNNKLSTGSTAALWIAAGGCSVIALFAGAFRIYWANSVLPRRQRARARAAMLRRYWQAASSGTPGVLLKGDYFTGRTRALQDINAVVNRESTGTAGLILVTGGPGSGKSAVIGRLLTLVAGPKPRIAAIRSGPDPGAIPVLTGTTILVHARGLTADQLAASIAEEADIDAASPEELLNVLHYRDDDLTIIVDALDEATDPRGIATQLLRPMAALASRCRLRVVVAGRPQVVSTLRGHARVIDLDSTDYANPADLVEYVRRCLLLDVDPEVPTPYRTDPELASRVAEAVALRAANSYLLAQLIARSLVQADTVADIGRHGWFDALPDTAGEAMREYLDRFGPQRSRVRDLLIPLAFSQGSGLSDEELWAALATALGTSRYSVHDIGWLLQDSGASDLLIRSEADVARTWRLYHETLAEYLRDHETRHTHEHAHQLITRVLLEHVPVRAGSRDWLAASPYTRTYLAVHASKCGRLDELLLDPAFLLAAEQAQVIVAATAAHGVEAVRCANAYRRAAVHLRDADAGSAASYLQLHARQSGADGLAERISALGMAMPWQAAWAHWRAPHAYLAVGKHSTPVTAVGVGAAGGRAVGASGGSDGSINVWDLSTGEPISTIAGAHPDGITALAVTTTAERVIGASGGSDGSINVWDLSTGEPISTIAGAHPDGITALAVTTTAERVIGASGGGDGSIKLWDLVTGEAVATATGAHPGQVSDLAIGMVDGELTVASCSRDRSRSGTVRTWQVSAGASRTRWAPLPTFSVAMGHVDGRPIVLAGTWPGTIYMWSGTNDSPSTLEVSLPVFALAIHTGRSHTVVLSASGDGSVTTWDLATHQQLGQRLPGYTGGTTAIAVNTVNGQPVAISGNGEGIVRSWNPAPDDTHATTTPGHAGRITSLTTTRLAGVPALVSGNDDGTLRFWGVDGTVLATTDRHAPIFAVAHLDLADGPTVITGDWAAQVLLWATASPGAPPTPLGRHAEYITALAAGLVAGTPIVVSGSGDGTAIAWNLTTRSNYGPAIVGHRGAVTAVALDTGPAGPVVVTGGADRAVRIWNAANGRMVLPPLAGHESEITALAVGGQLPVDRWLVSGSSDGFLRMWELASGQPIGGPMIAHANGVRTIVVTGAAGRQRIVSGGSDGAVRVWAASGEAVSAIDIGSPVWSLTVVDEDSVVAATTLGLVALQLGSRPHVARAVAA
jgi:WD40 repeat protein